MPDHLGSLAIILGLGALGQWLGWRFRLPPIILLLGFGLFLGPATGWLDPVGLYGDALLPYVSVAVGLILFEGGLTLNVVELRRAGGVIGRLVTLGVVITGVLAAAGAHYLLGFEPGLALLAGALLTVTGPTVVLPLLRTIRPRGVLAQVIKWEGILNDPVGALLAVLVYEVVALGGLSAAPEVLARGLAMTLFVGVGLAAVVGLLLVVAFRARWIPEFLHNLMALAAVVLTFLLSNYLQHESGLFTVTLLGVILANQKYVELRHIVEFKENLRVLLISVLFILLAARVTREQIFAINLASIAFLAFLIFVVRPAMVAACTIGSRLDWKERVFLCFMAPRGIVVTAVVSIFSLQLEAAGVPGAGELLAQMLFVVIGSVVFYGFAAGPAATWLGVSGHRAGGLLGVGAHAGARSIAKALLRMGTPVLLVDTRKDNVDAARAEGIPAECGDILRESFVDELDLSEVTRVLAWTSNDEVNALTTRSLRHLGERGDLFQLAPARSQGAEESRHLAPNPAFSLDATFANLSERFAAGAVPTERELVAGKDRVLAPALNPGDLPLFIHRAGGALYVIGAKDKPSWKTGDRLLVLPAAAPESATGD